MCGGRAPGMILRVLGMLLVVGAGEVLAQTVEEHLQICLDGFVVHKDKIIRTQDSREMGAKYLTVVDVEARIECMKWCCETEHCDVFIFEEKKPGSCYLFHCGPPHDFKCKFTSHANYSSAVLTNYNLQNAAALEEQIRRTEQEHELQSLRKVESPSKEYNYFTGSAVLTSTTSVPVPLTISTKSAPIKNPLCSHNQFECRSNDDCIAIYNVCDGIPQCTDGSDEAADLGCPVDKTTVPPPQLPPMQIAVSSKPYVPLPQEVLGYQQMMQQQQQQRQQQQHQQQQQQQQHGQYPMVYADGRVHEGGKGWGMNPDLRQMAIAQEINYGARGYVPLQQIQTQQSQEESVGMGQQPPINYKPSGYQWSNYQGPIYEQNANKINNEAAFDVLHAQNILPSNYEQEQPSRIFNHKGPGLRFNDMEVANGAYGQDPSRGYVPYYPAGNHRENSWQDGNLAQLTHVPVPTANSQQEHPDDEPKKQSIISTSVAPCDPAMKQEGVSKPRDNDDKKSENIEIHKAIESVRMEEKDNSKNKQVETHEAREAKVAPENDDKTNDHKAHELELRTMAESHLQEPKNLAVAEHIHHRTQLEDLEMSRPKGAVISLALGLTVTAVMAVLIACRLRVVKRRVRGRGHDSYAHDADYLVNGMYL